jgi:hypothetical protein
MWASLGENSPCRITNRTIFFPCCTVRKPSTSWTVPLPAIFMVQYNPDIAGDTQSLASSAMGITVPVQVLENVALTHAHYIKGDEPNYLYARFLVRPDNATGSLLVLPRSQWNPSSGILSCFVHVPAWMQKTSYSSGIHTDGSPYVTLSNSFADCNTAATSGPVADPYDKYSNGWI